MIARAVKLHTTKLKWCDGQPRVKLFKIKTSIYGWIQTKHVLHINIIYEYIIIEYTVNKLPHFIAKCFILDIETFHVFIVL